MEITQEIKNLCRNDAQLRFRDMNNNVQVLLSEARGHRALQFLHFGEWIDACVYTENVGMTYNTVYRIDPEFPVSVTDKKETMEITAKELAECQNTEKRIYAELAQGVQILIALAALNNRLQILDCDNRWRDSDTDILFDGYIYRICPTTPVIEDKKPEFVDHPVSLDSYGRYHITVLGISILVSIAPSYASFLCFVYTTDKNREYITSYLCPSVGTLKAVRFRNT